MKAGLGEVAFWAFDDKPARRARQSAPARQGVPQKSGREAQIGAGHPGRIGQPRPARPRRRGPARGGLSPPGRRMTTSSSTPEPDQLGGGRCAGTATDVSRGEPDVPSVRNHSALRPRAAARRVRRARGALLNQAEPQFDSAQADRRRARPSDSPHVRSDYDRVGFSTPGVPLALTGDSEIAEQFDSFTADLRPDAVPASAQGAKRSRLGIDRIASMW